MRVQRTINGAGVKPAKGGGQKVAAEDEARWGVASGIGLCVQT